MFKVIWDKENNGVRLTMSGSNEALNVPPRPVFFEELDFFELHKQGWTYPRCSEPLLWACERRYFYRGELVLELKGGDLLELPTLNIINPHLEIIPCNLETLVSCNSDTMFLLEREAMDFIGESYISHLNLSSSSGNLQSLAEKLSKDYNIDYTIIKEGCGSFDIMSTSSAKELGKRRVYNSNIEVFVVSFSGGKDSQVVLDLVSRVIAPTSFRVIYSNTGYELPTSLNLYEKIKEYYIHKYPGLEFDLVENHQPVLFYWDKMDSPSKIHRWCCSVMKTAPFYRHLKQVVGKEKQPNVFTFEGVRGEESSKRASYSRIGNGVKHSNVVNARPIFEWSQTEVWLYILSHHLPINQAYRQGLNRVGCVLCPLSSELGDCLDHYLFPKESEPFITKLRQRATAANVHNIEPYLKERKWKVRAGGNNHNSKSSLEVKIQNGDFEATILNPEEDILQWVNVLGEITIQQVKEETRIIQIKFRESIYNAKLTIKSNEIVFIVKNCIDDPIFVTMLKRVLNKVTYCVHCEVCEIECPTGALSVVPNVTVDTSKCVHCLRCVTFKDNGCMVANSIKSTQGLIYNKTNNMTPINRINTFGLRLEWLKKYMNSYNTFFKDENHGLNVKKQLPIFTTWLRDSMLIDPSSKEATNLTKILANLMEYNRRIVCEIIWINLTILNELCSWYSATVEFHRPYMRAEIASLLSEKFENVPESSRENALKALMNTFKNDNDTTNTLGGILKIGVVSGNGKPIVTRLPYEDLSMPGLAYSLYRYGEQQGRKSLTVSELMAESQTEGPVKLFGISRDTLEDGLRALDQANILKADLKMGLDNINLRQDLSALDALKMSIEQI